MARVILTCGLICAGKTTYLKRLCRELPAVLLSADEIMLSLFGPDAGEKHDLYLQRLKGYLLDKASRTAENGICAAADLGLWTREERRQVRAFFAARGIPVEIHYLRIGEEAWRERILSRGRAVREGRTMAYAADEGLIEKCLSLFEDPEGEEAVKVIRAEDVTP